MSTLIRPKISKKNQYYISKHRYYELKHFCLQYYEWKEKYAELTELVSNGIIYDRGYGTPFSDTTCSTAMLRVKYYEKMKLVEDTAKSADAILSNYIFKAVTEDRPFTYLKAYMDIPCERDMYYLRYRKFFWILDQKRS